MEQVIAERAQRPAPEARKLRDSIEPLIKALNENSRSAYRFADRQLHEHPWGAASAVFGLGVAFGALVALAARRH